MDRRRPVRLPHPGPEGGRHPLAADRLRQHRDLHAGNQVLGGGQVHRQVGQGRRAGRLERWRHRRVVRRQGVAVRLLRRHRTRYIHRPGQRQERPLGGVRHRRQRVPQRAQARRAHVLLPARRDREDRGLRRRRLDRQRLPDGRRTGFASPRVAGQDRRDPGPRSARRLVRRRGHQPLHRVGRRHRHHAPARVRREPIGLRRRLQHPRVRQRDSRSARRDQVRHRLGRAHAEPRRFHAVHSRVGRGQSGIRRHQAELLRPGDHQRQPDERGHVRLCQHDLRGTVRGEPRDLRRRPQVARHQGVDLGGRESQRHLLQQRREQAGRIRAGSAPAIRKSTTPAACSRSSRRPSTCTN